MELKCENSVGAPALSFSFGAGSSSLRGPVTNDFSKATVKGLDENAVWDLQEEQAPGAQHLTLIVRVEEDPSLRELPMTRGRSV
mmetsp:Transcript_95167/g.254413  ORF Transcript_95167/g.254413 Transcript_95167/m.254413 type:complete len:84 (+) Transcript_95167:1056-1307(+)